MRPTGRPAPWIIAMLVVSQLFLAGWPLASSALQDSIDSQLEAIEPTEIAITVDDLPVHGEVNPGMTPLTIASEMIAALKAGDTSPVYGFSNGAPLEWDPQNIEVLRLWHEAGYHLGNHTYSHLDLAEVSVEQFVADVKKLDALLSVYPEFQVGTRVFRYPYLSEGNTPDKRQMVRQYLATHDYVIAPVTVDFHDWAFAAAYLQCSQVGDDAAIDRLRRQAVKNAQYRLAYAQQLAKLLLGRDIKHVLLLHLSVFTARVLPDVFAAFKADGVKFVDLHTALSDPVYQSDPNQLVHRDTTFLLQLQASYDVDTSHLQPLYDAARPEEIIGCRR